MNQEDIIREWFYRLPKGYAHPPYSKREMDTLHEVLSEHGLNGSIFVKEIDQLDQAFHDAKPVKDKKLDGISEDWIWEESLEDIEEIELQEQDIAPAPTTDELAALLSDTDRKYSDKILRRVGELLNVDTLSSELVEKEMTAIMGSDANHVDDILDIVMKPGTDQPKFAAYMQNRTIPYTVFMGSPTSLIDAFKDETGLSATALERLAMYKWPSMPAIGPIEVMLALLLKDGERPTGKEAGDLRVAGKPFEVKGFSARLKGQKGFGSAAGVRKAFISAYDNLDRMRPINAPVEQSAWGSGQWLNTLDELNERTLEVAEYDDIINAMKAGFMAAYTNMSSSDLDWISSYVDQTGKINRSGFIRKLAETAFAYYVGVEDIDVFCVTNATLAKGGPAIASSKVLMFSPSSFPKYLGSQIGIVMPSYADSAGPQGVAFGLKLGTKTKALT